MNQNTTVYPGSNVIIPVAEAALVAAITNQVYPYPCPVYSSDSNQLKDAMPYIVVHVTGAQEQIGPGSGVFKVQATILFRSHVKPEDVDFRTSICNCINNFLWNQPAVTLNLNQGFYVYGFIPGANGQMAVNPEQKAYEYQVGIEMVCMPSNNQ